MKNGAVPLIEAKGLTKHYPGVAALTDVDFTLAAGEVHVLFGENGAGKSTLISILAGASAPTAGTVLLRGTAVEIRSVRHARSLGISAVFQEFSLIPSLTVAENLMLGNEPTSGPFLNGAAARLRARRLFGELQFDIDLRRLVSRLSRGEQQMVEIAKAMRSELSVLILDEPTASLTDRETERLFALIATLKQRGIGTIYISHRIHEFARLADRITVLRDGRTRGTVPGRGASEASLLSMMAGRELGAIYPSIARSPSAPIAVVEDLHTRGVRGAGFAIRPGEVTGFAGLVGSGKSRVWRAVMGLQRATSGKVCIQGRDMRGCTTGAMMDAGLFYLPPDRKGEGLLLSASGGDNIVLGMIGGRAAAPRGRRLAAALSNIAAQVGIAQDTLRRRVSHLSGGNQQKVLFGKGFGRPFDLYVFDEPTVGVDVATRAQLYRVIQGLVESGKAVVLISSDLQEILHLSHRLIVFAGGRISAELEGGAISEEAVLGHFFHQHEAAA